MGHKKSQAQGAQCLYAAEILQNLNKNKNIIVEFMNLFWQLVLRQLLIYINEAELL